MKSKILYRVKPGNFGDDLNSILIPPLLGGVDQTIFLDVNKGYPALDDVDQVIVSIGTILNRLIPDGGKKYVLGAGTGYGELPLFSSPELWDFRFVRGPMTAREVNKAGAFEYEVRHITDPAILLKGEVRNQVKRYEFGFIPHHGVVSSYWKKVCEDLGGIYIDPRERTQSVLSDIQKCNLIVAEAMHGAIVADTLRIPWVAVKTADKINEFKWKDWTGSMSLEYFPTLLPSIWDCSHHHIPKRAMNWAKSMKGKKELSKLIASQPGMLSDDGVFSRQYDDVLNEFECLRNDIG